MKNKQLVKKAQEVLKDFGHDVPIGHIYEMFSKLSGLKSWNVASAKNIAFVDLIQEPQEVLTTTELLTRFRVTLRTEVVTNTQEIELRKDYIIAANNDIEAKTIMQEYIDVQNEEIEPSKIKYDETKLLLAQESQEDFQHSNWKVVYNTTTPKITNVD